MSEENLKNPSGKVVQDSDQVGLLSKEKNGNVQSEEQD